MKARFAYLLMSLTLISSGWLMGDSYQTGSALTRNKIDSNRSMAFLGESPQNTSASVTLNVPAYLNHNGSGPTTAGMILGYWDGNGFPNLVPGSAATQTSAVDDMISSTGNYDDYCVPIDSGTGPILDDKSEPPEGDEHPDDCLADFMTTSQSFYDHRYEHNWSSDIEMGLPPYVEYAAQEYTGYANEVPIDYFTWEDYKTEIDSGRPMILTIDQDGNGFTDMFVTAIGYNEDGETNLYAYLNTQDTNVHWIEFANISMEQPGGIYSATLFDIEVDPGATLINEVDPNAPNAVELYNIGGLSYEMTGLKLRFYWPEGSYTYTFPTFTLQPGAYVVVHGSGNPDDDSATDLYTGQALDLDKDNGAISLFTGSGVGVDFVRWGASTISPQTGTTWVDPNAPPILAGRTLGRDARSSDNDNGNDWCVQDNSLGAVNSDCLCMTPGMPVLLYPRDEEGIADSTPTFTWESSNYADEYQFQLDIYSSFSTPELDILTASTAYTPTEALQDGAYYWRVRGHHTTHCDQFGAWSEPNTFIVSSASPFDLHADWASSTPTIDGTISTGEWDAAASYDIIIPIASPTPGVALIPITNTVLEFWDGDSNTALEPTVPANPNASPVTLYVMNDQDTLYLAMDNPRDTTINIPDLFGLFFDDNPLPSDGLWTLTSCGNPTGEGSFRVLSGSTRYQEWIDGPTSCTIVNPAPGVLSGVSYNPGHFQAEVAINLHTSALRAYPGEAVKMFIWVKDAEAGGKEGGRWPLVGYFQDPSTYRTLFLAGSRISLPLVLK